MLEEFAFCTVVLDQGGLWISFLPEQMKNTVFDSLGFDPWGDDAISALRTSIGVASGGDTDKALTALFEAEKRYHALTVDQVKGALNECGAKITGIISASDK